MQELLSGAIVCLRKREQHVRQVGPQNLVSAHKLLTHQLAWLASVFEGSPESQQSIDSFVHTDMAVPGKVDTVEMGEWSKYGYNLSCRARSGPPAEWLKAVSTQRWSLSHAALVEVDPATGVVLNCNLFHIALQKLMGALFQVCTHERQLGFASASAASLH